MREFTTEGELKSMRLFHKLISWILVLVLAAAVLPASAEQSPDTAVPSPSPDSTLLRLHQIDIGCGDAYLLTVGDYTVLVDCGTDSTLPIAQHVHNYPLFDYLEAVGIDHVDLYFVTHWHNDHCYNVNYFLGLYGTENTVTYGVSEEYFPGLAPLPAGTYQQMINGGHVQIGPLDILCIGPVDQENLTGNINPQSMNFIVSYGSHRFLFTGDWVDQTVADRWPDEITGIDVLSFPHHGHEPMYITRKCYAMMNPRVVLIPGRGSYNVRKFVKSLGLLDHTVLLSGNDGNILVTSDGSSLWVASHVRPGEFPVGDLVPVTE